MTPFRDLPIKRKLTHIMTVTSGATLVLACVAFVTYELVMFRRTMVRDLATSAAIIGSNSTAALVFNDQRSAEETLAALRAQDHIIDAAIYSKDGRVLARYVRLGVKGEISVPQPEADGHRFGREDVVLFRRIVLDDETIGTVYMRSDLLEVYSRLRLYITIVAIVLVAASAVAFMLSSALQRVISQPVLHLADTARAVSDKKNYAVRAVAHGKDEIGQLVEAFNQMLTQIQERDTALQRAHDELETRVEERTRELQEEIKERRRAEDEVRRLNVELERRVMDRTAQLAAANKELEAFSYSVSHDLRAPLRSIDGFSQVLLKHYREQLDPQGQNYLERVRASSQRMGQLIDDLLNLSRMTRGELRREPVDLSAVARAVAGELQQAEPDRQVTFVIADGLVVDGDPRLLRVVLENLLDNAWKFTGKHPRARIEFGRTQRDGDTVYFVRDNGVGFNMAYADKLFGAFQRLHTRAEFEGTGIGLATVQRIIHRHGGGIRAEGAEGQGATFYFTL
jgi:signal transduction histidine kinase